MSEMYGTKVQTVREAELRAVLVGVARSPRTSGAPLVMDAQTEWKKMIGLLTHSARQMCQGTNVPLECRVRRVIEQRADVLSSNVWDEEVETWGNKEVLVAKGRVGGKHLVWVHSHQKGKPTPNAFVVGVNEAADRAADSAADKGTLPAVRMPAGLSRFCYTIGGAAVVENVGKFIRRHGASRAKGAWAMRERQGAVAREIADLYKGVLPCGSILA